MNQTYGNLQIILVDDGSTDGSAQICDMYARQDERIQVIHKENGGLVSARKAGLEVAEGEYIGFVDGDDYVDIRFYEVMLKDMLENDVDFVHTGFICQDRGYDQFESKRYILSKENTYYFIKGLFGREPSIQITPSIWSKLFKKDFITRCYIRVPEEQSYGEDFVCICICLMEAKAVYLHKTALYHYSKRKGSLTDADYTTSIIGICQLYHSVWKVFQEYNEYGDLLSYYNSYIARHIFKTAMRMGRDKGCILTFYLEDVECLKGKSIVVYGAGKVGQDYYTQLCKYVPGGIIGWVDQRYQDYHFDYAEVQPVEQLQKLQYDTILIAIKDRDRADQIKIDLVKSWHVPEEKIMWQRPALYMDDV